MQPSLGVASPNVLCLGATLLHGRMAASWTQWGDTIGPCPSRYALGVCPTISRKVRLNVPTLLKPTSKQTSVTVR